MRNLLEAYERKYADAQYHQKVKVGISAPFMRRIVEYGCTTTEPRLVGNCYATMFAFLFHLRSVSLNALRRKNCEVTATSIRLTMAKRKEKALLRPLVVMYNRNPALVEDNTPFRLATRWSCHNQSDLLFAIDKNSGLNLATSVAEAQPVVRAEPPSQCIYGSHSPRISSFYELLHLGLPKELIMHRFEMVFLRT